jgi:hypothetical protein
MRRHSPRRQKRPECLRRPLRSYGCARNGIARRRIGGKHMAHLKFDQEITALLVIDSGNHLVCGGAVQAAGGAFMARLGRGRRGLGALVGHGGQHELGDRRRRDHERSGAWSVRALCPRRRRIMSAVASSPTWRHVLTTVGCLQHCPARGPQRRADGSVRRCPGLRQRPGRSGRRQSHSPLPYQYSGRGPRRPAPTHRGDTVAGQEVRAAFRSLRELTVL